LDSVHDQIEGAGVLLGDANVDVTAKSGGSLER